MSVLLSDVSMSLNLHCASVLLHYTNRIIIININSWHIVSGPGNFDIISAIQQFHMDKTVPLQ